MISGERFAAELAARIETIPDDRMRQDPEKEILQCAQYVKLRHPIHAFKYWLWTLVTTTPHMRRIFLASMLKRKVTLDMVYDSLAGVMLERERLKAWLLVACCAIVSETAILAWASWS